MGDLWSESDAGVLRLPSGRLIRGRGLRRTLDATVPTPSYGVYLLGERPPEVPWQSGWIRWPDFRLPADRAAARELLADAWERAAGERVEIACRGGTGRTGTALACLAVLDGVPPGDAVAFVRRAYRPRAVETRRQARFVAAFPP